MYMHLHIPVHMCISTHIERGKGGWREREGNGRAREDGRRDDGRRNPTLANGKADVRST